MCIYVCVPTTELFKRPARPQEGKQCPVCGMQASAEHAIDFNGNQSLFFCNMGGGQRKKFLADPVCIPSMGVVLVPCIDPPLLRLVHRM